MNEGVFQFGIAGLALMVVWRLLGMVQFKWMARQTDINGTPFMTPLACQTDPEHFMRIKRMDAKLNIVEKYAENNEPAMRKVRDGVASGAFSCTWKDRDEVLLFQSAMRENTKATNYLTNEIRNLIKQNGK